VLLAGNDVGIEVARLGQFQHLEAEDGKERRQYPQSHDPDNEGVEVGEGGILTFTYTAGNENNVHTHISIAINYREC